MARIKISEPEKYIFSTELEIRISDINYGGHLGNDRVLLLAHEARIRFLKKLGYSENNIETLGIIMTDAAVIYKSEGFLGDTINIEIGISEISGLGFDLIYSMKNITSGKMLALVKTGVVFFDYNSRKMKPVPNEFIRSFSRLENS